MQNMPPTKYKVQQIMLILDEDWNNNDELVNM